jgi:hypothetical protein
MNTVSCSAQKANTGYNDCPVHLRFEYAIEVGDKEFTDVEIDAMIATLNTGAKSDVKATRFYPFPNFIKSEITGGDPNRVEFENTQEVITWENMYKVKVNFYDGGFPLNDFLRTRNGQTVKFLFAGKNGGKYIIFGANANGKRVGIAAENFWAEAQMIKSFKNANEYAFNFNVQTSQLNDGAVWFVEVATNPATIKGLKTVPLVVVPTGVNPISVAGIVNFTAKQNGFGEDYLVLYPAPMAILANYTAKNAATGLVIPITAAAIVGGLLQLTLTAASPNYPAIGGSITVSGPLVSVADLAGIKNTEIVEVTFIRTV